MTLQIESLNTSYYIPLYENELFFLLLIFYSLTIELLGMWVLRFIEGPTA